MERSSLKLQSKAQPLTIKFARAAASQDRQQNELALLHRIFSKSLDALVQALPVEVQSEALGLKITEGEPQQLCEQLNADNLPKASETKERLHNKQ
ncbi:hypothetical protein KBI23_09800 [bacterium]|nr:hypothetical protein [bacterium]MBP9808579.1 hypothetical protein [bacterium]